MPKAEYTQGNIAAIMLKTAVAMLASTLAMSGYNIVDTYFVGQIGGEAPLAAMGYTFPVVMLVGCFFHGFGTGCMATMAHAVGRGDMKDAAHLVTGGMQILVCLSVVIAIFGLSFSNFIFGTMGAQGHTLELTNSYMSVWFLGCVTSGITMEGNKILIAAGYPRVSSAMTILGMVINAILDPLFIFGGHACHDFLQAHLPQCLHGILNCVMALTHSLEADGIRGAATATVLSQMVSAAVILFILHRARLLEFKFMPWTKFMEIARTITRYAVPAILGMLLFPISNYITTWITSKFGDTMVAGVGAATRLENVAFVLPMAFGITLMPIIAQNYGAKLYSRVKIAYKFAVSMAFLFLNVVAVILFFFGHNIAPLITPEVPVQEVMTTYMRIVPFGFFMLEITRFCGFALIGCGHPVQDTVVKAIRILLVMLPLHFVVLAMHWQTGIFVARLLTDLIGGAIFVFFAVRMLSKLPEDGC